MSSPRAVAINAAIVGERPTGLGVVTLNVIGALSELGERLTVYTSCPAAVRTPGVNLKPAPASVRPERGIRGHLARLAWAQWRLGAELRRSRADVVLHPLPEAILGLALPQVAIVHDLLPLHFPREYPRMRFYFRYWVPRVLRACQAVIADSEATRRELVRFYGIAPEQVHVAPLGYDRRCFTPEGPVAAGAEPYALFVGNILPHKNLVRLVDAFALATTGRPGLLRIRGGGQPRHVRALRERIAGRGLEARVDWQPYVPAAELAALYRGARVLLLPSLAEGFGLTALEAMACGTPVITANVSSMPEVVGDSALLVDPLDVAALADAIGRMLGDDVLAKTLAEQGLARAQQFSWRRTGEAVQRALDAAQGRAA